MRLCFNEDLDTDLTAILAFLEGVGFNDSVKKMAIDVVKIRSILNGIRQDFPHNGGLANASIFKKVATFMVYFISEKPIQSGITGIPNIPEEISRISNHVNILIALLIAFTALHGASIHYVDGNEKKLVKKIVLSKHSFIDLIDALSGSTPVTHFKILSVFLEQLAYKSNPECQYETFDY